MSGSCLVGMGPLESILFLLLAGTCVGLALSFLIAWRTGGGAR